MKSMIIIPTYNEKDNIEKLINTIYSYNNKYFFTVIDDNSPDGTGEILDKLASRDERIHVIHRKGKLGLGSAYLEGFQHALDNNMDYIFQVDADFSHNPKYLSRMLESIKDADLVIGSRYYHGVRVEGWRFRRLLLSKFANIFASYFIILPVWDFTSGFKCFRRETLERIDFEKVKSDGYAFQIEMTTITYRLGLRIKEIPIIFLERASGESKMSKRVVWEAFWIVIRYRSPLIEIIKHLKFFFKDYSEFANNRDQFDP